jgi:DNA polymerase-4/DNA polymerase V
VESNWPNAVAHVDADCFFASCERLRHPELKDTPLCVLSSQDACVVAKTYDARAAGITTGMPVWEARKILPHAAYLSADFGYYGKLSDKLFAVLSRYSPELEACSIDEGFINLNGLRGLWRKGYQEIADAIRDAVRSEIGISVSVGVSVTKTLAKIASDFHKPDGTTVVSGRQIGEFLQHVKVKDIPGIGANRQALLHKFGIVSADQYIATDEALIRRLLGKSGTDLWQELRGTSIFRLELAPRLPKSIARTASLGEVTDDRDTLAAHLTHHTTRLASELITKRYVTSRLTVFLTLKSFDKLVWEARFQPPTASYFRLSAAVRESLGKLYRPEQFYRGCGVVAAEIASASSLTPDLFGATDGDERQGKLLETVVSINRKFGKETVQMLAALPLKGKKPQARFQLPLFEVN